MAATDRTDVESLIAELEQAEAYEQRLRQLIVDVRDQLAAGRHAAALSMLNAALNDIDRATDVVTFHRQ
jgi:ribosomal protein S20